MNIIKPVNNFSNYDIIIYKNEIGDRKMQFDIDNDVENNVFQSSYNLNDLDKFYLTYLNFVTLLFLYVSDPKSFLIIGLGGGHYPMFLNSKISNCSIDVVELNQQVVNAAIEMGYNLNNIIIMNGVDYINQTTKKYDTVIIDLDGENSYFDFDFQKIFDIVKNDGILVVNSYSKHGKSTLKNKIKKSFKLVKHFVNKNSNVFLCKKNIDMFEEMLEQITKQKIESNIVLFGFKYKDRMLEILNQTKISITLN